MTKLTWINNLGEMSGYCYRRLLDRYVVILLFTNLAR